MMASGFFWTVVGLILTVPGEESATQINLDVPGVSPCCARLSISKEGLTNLTVGISADLKRWELLLSAEALAPKFEWLDRGIASEPLRFYHARAGGLSVDEQEAAWSALGLSRYRFHFTRTCYCEPTILSGTVTVTNGVVAAVANAFNGQIGQPIPLPKPADFKTIEQLFGVTREAQANQAALIVVREDPVLKFPSQVTVDYLAGAVDDEITYEVSAVEPID